MKHIWSEDPAGLAGPKATKPHRGNNCDVKLLLVQAGVTVWHITGRTLGDLGSLGKKNLLFDAASSILKRLEGHSW